MSWFRTRVKPVKVPYRPFSEPRYRGSMPFPKRKGSGLSGGRTGTVYNDPSRARYYTSNAVALSGFKRPLQTAVRVRTAFGAVNGSTAWGTRQVVRNGYTISPDIERRLKEHIRRSSNKPNWRPVADPKNIARFISVHGMDAFKLKVCQERAARREVMHAKGIAGTRVSVPTFDARSLVRC